jgi:hypothetical protein
MYMCVLFVHSAECLHVPHTIKPDMHAVMLECMFTCRCSAVLRLLASSTSARSLSASLQAALRSLMALCCSACLHALSLSLDSSSFTRCLILASAGASLLLLLTLLLLLLCIVLLAAAAAALASLLSRCSSWSRCDCKLSFSVCSRPSRPSN